MSSSVKRKSAAVMFTDIAGYTNLMATDEEKALSLLHSKRDIIKPLIEKYDGVYVKGTGDGTLSYFESAYKASKCAKTFQESIYDDKNMNVRVGIHIGDIVFEEEDVYGDGVNVAARLESMAPVGGICVSNTVYDELRNKKEFDGIKLGLQSLKGVGRLVEVFGLKGEKLEEPNLQNYKQNEIEVHSDDEVPSLAIIPLKNKGAGEDVFYAYGISADLIKDCSSAGLIRVESLDRIEKISGYENLDIKDLASTLSVRYILTGTLWKMNDFFQLSIELYDTKKSQVVWSDRWEENWKNLSDIQIKLADNITKVMNKTILGRSDITTNADAYEYYLRGAHKYENRSNVEDTKVAQELLIKSIDLDTNLIKARLLLGWSYHFSGDTPKAIELYEDILKKAYNLNDKSSISLCLRRLGVMYNDVENNISKGLDYNEQALTIAKEINDNDLIANCLEYKALLFGIQDNYIEALEFINKALELRKKIDDRHINQSYNNIGHLYLWQIPDYEKALDYFNLGLEIASKNDNKHGRAWCVSSIGFYYWNIGDHNRALKYFKDSTKLFEELGDTVLVAQQLTWGSLMNWELGNLDTANHMIEKSSKIFNSVENKNHKWEFICTYTLVKKDLGMKSNLKGVDDQLEIMKGDRLIPHYIDWFYLYLITDNLDYLDLAYKRLHELSKRVDFDLKEKLFNYPLAVKIIKEWDQINN